MRLHLNKLYLSRPVPVKQIMLTGLIATQRFLWSVARITVLSVSLSISIPSTIVLAQPWQANSVLQDQRFLQRTPNSCGLSVIAYAIAALTGRVVDQRELSQLLAIRYPKTDGKPPVDGYSLADLVFAFAEFGYQSAVVRATPSVLFSDVGLGRELGRYSNGNSDLSPFPLILRLPFYSRAHYVVLTRVMGDQVEIFDPASGVRRLSADELQKRWLEPDGTGLLFFLVE